MREARVAYLPKWPNEQQESYDTRLSTATLYPAYQHTVETLAAKPFSRPVTIGEDVPPQIKEWSNDIDQEGRNLHVFGSDLMEGALGEGLCGVLVEYPEKPEGTKTIADERAIGLRPYFVHIKACQLIACFGTRVQGKWVIQQLRFMECVDEPDGAFGVKNVDQVRVLEPGKWATYRQNEKKEWVPHLDGTTTLNYVPFVPVYGRRTGFVLGKPPMIELAHMNVKHWQSQSDQDTLLHVARVPILVRTGIQDAIGADGTPVQNKLVIGAGVAVDLPTAATLTYTEHSGAAIGAGKIALDDLKEEMRQAGAEMLVIKPGTSTRIADAADNAKGMCALQRVTLGLQDALNAALQMMADWVKLPTGGHVTIFNDFGSLGLDAAVADIVSLQQGGIISKETAFKESQRRGVVSADVQFDDDQERIQGEGPALGAMGAGDPLVPRKKSMTIRREGDTLTATES